MSEISLREYLSDLDRLLNQHAADDVILHSRHILQYYPKIVDGYRFLGRALILNGRWDEAEAALRRVIAVVPDDYYAHTGLSEIYDRNRRGDEAIWHLERALEQNPNQRELIDSLRSLYKRYRNIDQAKVPMTAGAVARQAMANQSYEQAIETLRSALVRHKDRIDLRLLLAESLWAGSDPVEAAEAAMDVLEVLPDCLAANAIMTRLWLQEGRSSDAQRYLNRVEAVAPYLAVEIATNQPVDDDAFHIEKLDVKRSAQAELSMNRPDWLQDISPQEAAAQATADEWSSWSPESSGLLAAAGAVSKQAESAPADWSSDAQTSEQPVPSLFDYDQASEPLIESASDTDMPEWMNAPTMQVPLSAVQAAQADHEQEEDALAWLQSTESPSLDDEMPPDELLFGMSDAAPSSTTESEPMDWLSGFEEDGATSVTPVAEIPDWMMDDPLPARNIPEPDFTATSPTEPAQAFDWAANDQFLDEALGIENLAGNESAPMTEPTIEDLDWLAGAAAFEQTSEEAVTDPPTEMSLTGILGETSFDPFEAAAEAAPQNSEEVIAEDDAWLAQVSNEPAGVPGPKRGLTAMLKDANFDWMSEETSTETPTAIDQTMDDWTRQFAPAPAESDDSPAWLNAIESSDDTAVMRAAAKAEFSEVAPLQEDAPTAVLDAAALTAAEAAQIDEGYDWANVKEVPEDQAESGNAYPALDVLLGVGAATAVTAAAVEAFDNDEAATEAAPISESDLDWLGEVGVTVEESTSAGLSASDAELAALFGGQEVELQQESITDTELDWLNEADPALADQLTAESAVDREDDLEALFAVGETGLADLDSEIARAETTADDDLEALFAVTETNLADQQWQSDAATLPDDQVIEESGLDWLSEVDPALAGQLATEPTADREDDLEAMFAVAETAAAENDLDWLGQIDAGEVSEAEKAVSTAEDDLEALFAVTETELADEQAQQVGTVAVENDLDWLSELDPELADQLAVEPAADREDDLEALFAVTETELADELAHQATTNEDDLEALFAVTETEIADEQAEQASAIAAEEDDLAALFASGAEEGNLEAIADTANEAELDWLNEVDPELADQLAAETAADREDDLEALFAVGETALADAEALENEISPEAAMAEADLEWLAEDDPELAAKLLAEDPADREDDLEAAFAVAETAVAENDLEWLTEAGVIVEDEQPVEAIAASETELAAMFGSVESESPTEPEVQEDNEFDAIFAAAAVAGLGAVAMSAADDDDEAEQQLEAEIASETEFEPTTETEVAEIELDWLSSEGDAAELSEEEIIEAESNAVIQGLMNEFGLPVDEQIEPDEEMPAQPEPAPESEDAVNWWETPESEEAPEAQPEAFDQFTDAEQQVAEVSIAVDDGGDIVDWFVDAELDEAALDSAPEMETDPTDWYADAVQDEPPVEAAYVADETQFGVETLHFATNENTGEFPAWIDTVEETGESVETLEAQGDDVIDESVSVIDFLEVTSVVSEIGENGDEVLIVSETDADANVFAEEDIVADEIAADWIAEASEDDFLEENVFASEGVTDLDGMPVAEVLAADSFIEDDGGDEALLNDEPDEISPLAAAAALGAVGFTAAAVAGDEQSSEAAEIPEETAESIEQEIVAETEGEPIAEFEAAEPEAINAPDWLNAMVPGLDVDYEAEEDQPIETEYLEAEPEAILTQDELTDSESGWLEEMIAQEERETAAALETADAVHEPHFKFSREPIWFRHQTDEDDVTAPDATENTDSDLPEWLR